jgi:hypothetical protein
MRPALLFNTGHSGASACNERVGPGAAPGPVESAIIGDAALQHVSDGGEYEQMGQGRTWESWAQRPVLPY